MPGYGVRAQLVALRTVEAGEALCISYINHDAGTCAACKGQSICRVLHSTELPSAPDHYR